MWGCEDDDDHCRRSARPDLGNQAPNEEPLRRAAGVFVEFAKRIAIARGILKPVHMTRVLQSHLKGLRKPASNNLSALSEDI